MVPFRSVTLDNGLVLEFTDRGNRYFGDYHRLQIDVHIRFCLPDTVSANQGFWSEARRLLGKQLLITRSLERMGVAGGEVDAVRERMVDDFLRHTAPYYGRAETPEALVAAELNRRSRGRRYG